MYHLLAHVKYAIRMFSTCSVCGAALVYDETTGNYYCPNCDVGG